MQVWRERRVSLAGIPWAINAQPVNRCDQIYQPRARQVSRTMYQLREAWAELAKSAAALAPPSGAGSQITASPGLTSHISKQPGQSAEFLGQARISGIVNHPVRNPHLVQRGQLRMASRREHGAGRPLDWADSAHSCE